MKQNLSRRLFVKQSALAASVFAAAPFNIGCGTTRKAGDKIRFVQIGCGGRGASSHLPAAQAEELVAIVDPDVTKHANVKKWLQGKGGDADKLQVFTDYRKMFDKVGKNIDAVFIASPNHHHALPALIAMQLGINVYCEKPVCHDIGEARERCAFGIDQHDDKRTGIALLFDRGEEVRAFPRLRNREAKAVSGHRRSIVKRRDRQRGRRGRCPCHRLDQIFGIGSGMIR